jgi:hypothetical protein
MARNRFTIGTEGEVELWGTTGDRDVLGAQAPANQMIVPTAIRFSFNGVTAGNPPILVTILRTDTDDSSLTRTAVKTRVGGPTVQTVGIHSASSGTTGNPTSSGILKQWEVHPQSGIEVAFDLTDEIEVDGGGAIALNFFSTEELSVVAAMDFEE